MSHRINYSRKNEKGIALVTTLLFLVVLGLLSTTLIFTVQSEIQSSSAYRFNQHSFYVADAGIQKALQWYRNSYTPHLPASDYDRTEYPVEYNNADVLLAGQTGYTSAFPETGRISDFTTAFGNKSLQANTKNTGVYAINATLMKYTPATFIDLATFTPYASAMERWRINSIGYWGNVNNPLGISRVEAIIENSGNALFDRGLWGIDSLTAGGGVIVDSFDPNKGPWHITNNNGYRGSVGSNGTVASNGGITVQGDVAFGPAGTFIVNGGSGVVSGYEFQLPSPRYFPPLPEFTVGSGSINANDDTELAPGEYGSISIGNNDLVKLSAGTYYIDEIKMTGGAIEVSGACTIYVKSRLSLSGQGIISPPGYDPQDVKILYSGESAASITGGSNAFIDLYAPNAQLNVGGGGEHHGSFIGKDLAIGGDAHVHFNEDNENNDLVQRPFRILSWSQKSN